MIIKWRETAIRSVGLMIALYLLVVIGVVALITDVLDDAAMDMMEATAKTLTAEIAGVVAKPVAEQYDEHDGWGSARIGRILSDLVEDSDVVTGAALVGSEGEYVATAGRLAEPRRLPPPSTLFTEDKRPRLAGGRGAALRGASFTIDYPVFHNQEAVAYFHLQIEAPELNRLYRTAYGVLAGTMTAGVLVIAGLAALLQMQFRKVEQLVVRRLDAIAPPAPQTAPPDRVPSDRGRRRPGSDRVRTFEAIDRLRRVLDAERDQTARHRRRVDRIERALDVGVVFFDSGGQVEFMSRGAAELLGTTEPHDDPADVLPGIERLLRTAREMGGSAEDDLVAQRSRRRLHAKVTTIRDGSQLEGFLCELRDRDELDALEADLSEAALLRSLTSLYLGVAHELKVPVNAMVLTVATLQADADDVAEPSLAQSIKDKAATLESELDRLRGAIELVLTNTAPGGSERGRFDLGEVASELGRMLAAQARQQRVQLDLEPGTRPMMVEGQRLRIRHAILNLVVNALEAMPDGGTLRLALEERGDEVAVVVADSGPGIDAAVKDTIFDLHVTTKIHGTGIGLHVSQRAFAAAGGRLRLVETGPGGTIFEAVLPRAHDQEESHAASPDRRG